MTNILVCLDGSAYAEKICEEAAWVAKKLNAHIDLLHVLKRHSDYTASGDDHTGAIGFGARTSLLERLTDIDEQRARLDQEKGRLILDHGIEILRRLGCDDVKAHHMRGNFLDIVRELETNAEMIFIGKRGEEAQSDAENLGSNLEAIARGVEKPLYVVSAHAEESENLVLAYDGKEASEKALDFFCSSDISNDKKCYLVTFNADENKIDTQKALNKLEIAGVQAVVKDFTGSQPVQELADFVEQEQIGLIFAGAYSHSRIRSLIWDSMTTSLIRDCHTSLLLFHSS